MRIDALPHAIQVLAIPRCRPPICFEAKASGSVVIEAPRTLAFAAYDDIERMPEWMPMLESVVFVDREDRRSEWTLNLPRPVFRIARAVGYEKLVRWEAVHRVESPHTLQWNSLSGFPNRGEMSFEPVDGDETRTKVTCRMTYELPDAAAPLLRNLFLQRFMRYTIRRAMERYRDVMEEEAATLEVPLDGADAPVEVPNPT
jgi:uncharacterized membrane protein